MGDESPAPRTGHGGSRSRSGRALLLALLVALVAVGAASGAVRSFPTVTVDPVDQAVTDGSTVTFTAAADGDPAPLVQWAVSTDGGATFEPIAGANSTTLTFTATLADDNKQYVAIFTNVDGVATSQIALLQVDKPAADLAVTQSASPATIDQGQTSTLSVTVENTGPGVTSATLTETLGGGLTLSSASASQGSCTGSGPVVCNLGSLAVDASATVTLVVTGGAAGSPSPTATAASTLPDPVASNNSATTAITVKEAATPPSQPPSTPPPLPKLPPPVQGKLVNAQPVSGTVLVDGVPLSSAGQLKVGSVVDVTKGSIELVSGNDLALFYGGLFRILQGLDPKKPTDLQLQGAGFSGCPKTTKPKTTKPKKGKRTPAAVAAPPKAIRQLWGDGKGNFRTVGRFSAATVRGTIWLMQERCDGTFVRVRRGVVAVQDLVLHRTVLVRAGQSYLARPR